jgi:hypothetical protein
LDATPRNSGEPLCDIFPDPSALVKRKGGEMREAVLLNLDWIVVMFKEFGADH